MEKNKSVFEKLLELDVSKYVEKNDDGLSYLSWAYAVRELRKVCPTATWTVTKGPSGEPFIETKCGFFVEVTVTVDGLPIPQVHPVLDKRHKPIDNPNTFQINTAIQRCLTKAIALHGLGLGLYIGEDTAQYSAPAPAEPVESVPNSLKLVLEEAAKNGIETLREVWEGLSLKERQVAASLLDGLKKKDNGEQNKKES